jgi:hypothetical protein
MNETENTSNVVNIGATHPPVTTRIDDIMALSPTGRVIQVEDCPEIKMEAQADE